jgi:EAL domain-containing protein (putative c-di-GMP-specific phosphodiesterase class I)
MFSYVLVTIGYFIIDFFLDQVCEVSVNVIAHIPIFLQLFIRDFLSQLFWFFGIHGPHMVNALFGKEFLLVKLFPNLTTSEFNRLFVMLGGSGIGIAMLIAIFLVAKETSYRLLAKISAPFVVFNINTLLIYPFVVLNRFFFVPFVILPLFNLIAGYIFLIIVPIHFEPNYITWITPVFINAYIKTGGDIRLILFQAVLIAIDTAVYVKYTKQFINAMSIKYPKTILQDNLGIQRNLKAKDIIKSFAAQKEVIEASAKLYEFLPTLTEKNLFIYYQPKVNIKNKTCMHYEALIRYNNNGKLTGPIFLDVIEKAGLAPIIDLWVAKRVKKDIQKWKGKNFFPVISINLHPDTLLDSTTVNEIIKILKDENVFIEIIERSFFSDKKSIENFKKLQQYFKVAIDDFGIGYSNFETLLKYKIDELKIDKALIDHIETKEGYIICKNITDICHNIGSTVVAEGIETYSQLQKAKEIGIDMVQGYYFSPAIPFEQVKEFSLYCKHLKF